MLKRIWNLKRNEKIHNRSKSRVAGSAGDDCPGIKDHGQRLDQTWSPDRDQWPEASSTKPQDPRISKQQARTAKRQAASFKLDKPQALGYYKIMKINKLIKKINKENTPPDGWKPEDDIKKAINWDKLKDPKVLKQLDKIFKC